MEKRKLTEFEIYQALKKDVVAIRLRRIIYSARTPMGNIHSDRAQAELDRHIKEKYLKST